MVFLYAARIEDLGAGDFVRVNCYARWHTALLAPALLSRLGLSPRHKVLDLKDRLLFPAAVNGAAVLSRKWAKPVACDPSSIAATERAHVTQKWAEAMCLAT